MLSICFLHLQIETKLKLKNLDVNIFRHFIHLEILMPEILCRLKYLQSKWKKCRIQKLFETGFS